MYLPRLLLFRASTQMSGGKRKPNHDLTHYYGGLLDLGDVSNDLATLGSGLDLCQELVLEGEGESGAECDYDSVSSPGGSTCSGPTYVRHVGFGPDRPASQLSSEGSPPPPSLSQSYSQLKGLASRNRLPLHQIPSLDSGKKKKKGLLCPDIGDLGPSVRGGQALGPSLRTVQDSSIRGVQVQSKHTARSKHKKGKADNT